MIILMLFIGRNLRLKILQMLQNGLIILTIWSLLRMVNFSHDSYDKCDDFDFLIVNFPYLSSNIPESPAYGVFVSQLIRCARVGSKYEDFLFRGSILVSKLLKQGYSSQTTFRKFYGHHTDLVHKLHTSVSHMFNDLFTDCDIWLVSSCFE